MCFDSFSEVYGILRSQFCPLLERADPAAMRRRQFKALKALFDIYEMEGDDGEFDDEEKPPVYREEVKAKTGWLVDLLDDSTGLIHEEIRQTGN